MNCKPVPRRLFDSYYIPKENVDVSVLNLYRIA